MQCRITVRISNLCNVYCAGSLLREINRLVDTVGTGRVNAKPFRSAMSECLPLGLPVPSFS